MELRNFLIYIFNLIQSNKTDGVKCKKIKVCCKWREKDMVVLLIGLKNFFHF